MWQYVTSNDTVVINDGYRQWYSVLQCNIMQYVTVPVVEQIALLPDINMAQRCSDMCCNVLHNDMTVQCNAIGDANGQALVLCYWRQPKTRLLSSYIWYKWQNKWCNGLQWNKTIYLQYQTSQMIQIAEGDERVTVWDFFVPSTALYLTHQNLAIGSN